MQVGYWCLRVLAAVVLALFLAGCATAGRESLPEDTLPVRAQLTPLVASTESCRGSFVEHVLDHTTTVPGGDQVRSF
jgi:outer membrane lipoprotein-sorting protein